MLGAGALGRPRGMVWGGRREEGSGWGTHVYLWRIHFDIWQNKYNYVKLKNIHLCLFRFRSAISIAVLLPLCPVGHLPKAVGEAIMNLI